MQDHAGLRRAATRIAGRDVHRAGHHRGFILFAGSRNGVIELHGAALFLDRLRMLAIALLAAALYDSLFAPTQALRWLQSVAAWEWSRTAVLLVGLALAGVMA